MAWIQSTRVRRRNPRERQQQLWLIRIWLKLLDHRNQKIIIQQYCDRQGRKWWSAYDPVRNHTVYFSSEDEVRIWLEQLHLLKTCQEVHDGFCY